MTTMCPDQRCARINDVPGSSHSVRAKNRADTPMQVPPFGQNLRDVGARMGVMRVQTGNGDSWVKRTGLCLAVEPVLMSIWRY